MSEKRFDELMRAAAQTYNTPPDLPPFDAMWASIEQARERGAQDRSDNEGQSNAGGAAGRRSILKQPWFRMVAVLVLGVALGRGSVRLIGPSSANEATVAEAGSAAPRTQVPAQYSPETDQYLGQTAALLIALPGELRSSRADSTYITRAEELLLQTRLLLDSPAASDPVLRALFEDLEVVLVQLVRLPADRDAIRVELLNEALKQRDVLPRLRNAVADNIAD